MKNLQKFGQFLNENQRYPWAKNLTEEDFARLYQDGNFLFWSNFMHPKGVKDPYAEIASYIEQKLDLEGDTWISQSPPEERNQRIFQFWEYKLKRHDFIDMFGDPYYWTRGSACTRGGGLWFDENDEMIGNDPDFLGCSWFVNLAGVLCHIFIDTYGVSIKVRLSESLFFTTRGHELVTNVFKELFDLYVRKTDWEKIFK